MQRRNLSKLVVALGLAGLGMAGAALAADPVEVVVGISLSGTGQAASLGIPSKNATTMYPKTVGGVPLRVVFTDDASDPTQASKNARQLVSADKVDVLIGTVTVPGTAAMSVVAAAEKTPLIGLAPYVPKGDTLAWTFQMNQPSALMAAAVFDHMKTKDIKSVGFIAFSGTYGDDWLREAEARQASHGFKVTTAERYERNDVSVTGQVLKIMSTKPDAVLIAAGGTPAALPQNTLREKGYKGMIYQTHGAVNADFLRVSGNSDEGVVVPSGPVMVAEQLPDTHPSKKLAVAFNKDYESRFGAGTRNGFAATAYDAYLLLDKAVPVALKKAKPGTPEFRAALRDAIEGVKNLPVTQGVYSMNATSHHQGFDENGRVLLTIEKDAWKLIGR